MLKVALTGGIATGKSYVRARIDARGIPTIDSDRVVHGLLAAGTAVTAEIGRRFGLSFLRPDGGVDRPALGRLVFGDSSARADLEAIVHPRVYERIFAWAAERESAGAAWVLADIPLLFETGRAGNFDRVVVASCPSDLQLQRLMARDRLSATEARARLAVQWPIEEKARRATDLVNTGGTFAETDRQVDLFCAAIDDLAVRRQRR